MPQTMRCSGSRGQRGGFERSVVVMVGPDRRCAPGRCSSSDTSSRLSVADGRSLCRRRQRRLAQSQHRRHRASSEHAHWGKESEESDAARVAPRRARATHVAVTGSKADAMNRRSQENAGPPQVFLRPRGGPGRAAPGSWSKACCWMARCAARFTRRCSTARAESAPGPPGNCGGRWHRSCRRLDPSAPRLGPVPAVAVSGPFVSCCFLFWRLQRFALSPQRARWSVG